MSDELVCIDASHWQETKNPPDWQLAIDNGIVGIFLKATEGTTYIDPTFRPRYDSAIDAGLAVSSYHFLRHGNITTQMNLYLNTVKPRDGERMVLDWEDAAVTVSEVEQAVKYLKSDDRNLQITIYASSSFIRERISKGSPIADGTSLWVASYTSNPQPSDWGDAWETWTMWQYTDKADIAGKGPVDGNRFNGTPDACHAWMSPAGEVIEPDEPDEEETVTVTIEVEAPDNVRVIVRVTGDVDDD